MHIKKIKPFIHAKYTQILPYRVRWYTCICHCRHFPEKWRRRAWFGSQYWRRTPWTCWPSSSPTTHTSTRPTTLRWGTASLGCSPSGRAPCHFTGKKWTPWFIKTNTREFEKKNCQKVIDWNLGSAKFLGFFKSYISGKTSTIWLVSKPNLESQSPRSIDICILCFCLDSVNRMLSVFFSFLLSKW